MSGDGVGGAGILSRLSPPSRYVGRWVQARSSDLGFGFCEKHPDGALIIYTDIPGLAEARTVVELEELRVPRISRGARIWVKGDPYGWHAAEVTGWAGFDQYYVRVAGMPHDLKLPSGKFTIRWKRPLSDPVGAVAQGLCDSPEYYEARRTFVDQLVLQRSACRGFAAALSAPVALYQHQLDTVARVMSDPVLRYLLADEVGLGKTIEAGLILRQLLLDDPEATALVTVPAALVNQWRDELQDRLLLGDFIRRHRLRLVSHESTADHEGLGEHALTVVDEAHQLLPQLHRRPRLREDLLRTKGLLLLSATPMRGNLSTFLELLNLVDPTAFPRDDLDVFEERVQQREQAATSLQVLTAHRASLRQRGAVLEDLLRWHGGDPVVVRLVEECQSSGDLASPVWSELANYVREVYRISRRVIRHRRNSAATEEYPVAGRLAAMAPLVDPARAVVDEFLERYRDHLAEREARRSYAEAVLHGLGGPRALLHHLEGRLALEAGTPGEVPQGDRALVEATVARLQLADTDTRTRVALEVVQERLDRDLKVVVIGTSSKIAREFHEIAAARWHGLVAGYFHGLDHDAREMEVSAFLGASGGRVLVGDHTLEEGRNLQDAHVLVNLDVPLDLNRLEQRIGRLDRFARRAEPAEIVVFTEPDSDWVTAHMHLLAEGIGILDRSVATLQRRLAAVLEDVVSSLQRDGSRAFMVDLPALKASLEDERVEIDLLEELESVTVASDFDGAGLANLREVDGDVAGLRAAFSRLTSMRGGIGLRPEEDPVTGVLRFGAERDGFVYGLSDEAVGEVRPLLGRPRAYAREVAIAYKDVAPLRLGDPLVEWLASHLSVDERGRARAIIRPHTVVQVPTLWMSLDFLAEFDAAHLHAEGEGIRRRLRRRGDAIFPTTIVRTWTDTAGPAPTTLVEEVLERPFDKTSDLVLRGPLWKNTLAALPDWQQLCRLSGEAGIKHVRTLPILTSVPMIASERARREVAARLAVLRARSQRLPSDAERTSAQQDMEREEMLGRALVQGVERPALSIIACGAVVLWPTS